MKQQYKEVSNQMIDYRIIVTALIVMGVLELYALSLGFNGVLLTVVLAAVAGIAGWTLPK